MTYPLLTHKRQVHLDFHTSPYIADAATQFDADAFARTFQEAHANSVTVFAKCHHGQCYYPTATGVQHPALEGRDLLGEQIEALHRRGIRCPIYTTIAWEEDVAARFPEWRQLRRDGTFAASTVTTSAGALPAVWKWLNFLHPDYQDYFEAHVREILDRYGQEVDGFFVDIVMMHHEADWSETGRRFREERGLLGDDSATFKRFEAEAQAAFCERFSRVILGARPDASLFFNSGTYLSARTEVGIRRRAAFQSHFEIESLPSGAWGYHHFPRLARSVSHWRKDGELLPWLGMTGRFQKQWGDFGGIKPQAALEYECFRSQALGGGNSVGDQLPPRGVLDPDAYALIGAVYKQVEAAEPFYRGSEPLAQVGIMAPFVPGLDEGACEKSETGAVMMCEEAHYDARILDDAVSQDEFNVLDLIIVPDHACSTPGLVEKLRFFYEAGGRLLFSHRALLGFLPLSLHGETEKWPTYWRASPEFLPQAKGDRVFYERGLNVLGESCTTLIQRVLPYFQRTDVTYCSHYQTPPQSEVDEFPAVIAGERFVYFADPIFREYRQTGNLAASDGWKAAVRRLIGAAPFGEGLPTTVLSVPRRRGDDLLLTLLHYVPVRKALDIDVIEERHSFGGERLRIVGVGEVRDFESGVSLVREGDGIFVLPAKKGRLLLEAAGYFKTSR